MYTNTVVRSCTDVFLADSLHVLLTVHLLNYGLHCQNKMHRKSKWMIYHWGSIFILWTNKRFASCKTYDSNHFKYDVRSLKRAMCDVRSFQWMCAPDYYEFFNRFSKTLNYFLQPKLFCSLSRSCSLTYETIDALWIDYIVCADKNKVLWFCNELGFLFD